MSMTRRDFLSKAFGASGWLAMTALSPHLMAGQSDDYKALVCILLEGGADVFNMIIPLDEDPYARYREARGRLALPRQSLLPIRHHDAEGNNPLRYGLRENMSRIQELFGEEKLAIVANVGTLVEPVDLTAIRDGSARLPRQLFAHNTQRELWLRGDARGIRRSGWAARAADRLGGGSETWFNLSVDGPNLLQAGGRARPLCFDAAEISPDTMRRYGFGPESGGAALGKTYQRLHRDQSRSPNRLMASMTRQRLFELNLPYRLEGLFDHVADFDGFSDGVHETGRPLGEQLKLVAQILSVRDAFPGRPRRQIFFVNHHGWDTHDSDDAHQIGYLSDSLGAFYDALEQLGITDSVTTLTLSDFGRSLTPNGAGSDHGWGTHALVLGGAVRGGEIYGTMPDLRRRSPDFWEDRLIPTLPVEAYLDDALRWLGATERDLDIIFPNRQAFSLPPLGYLG